MRKLNKLMRAGVVLSAVVLGGANQASAAESNTAQMNVELTITPGCSVGFGSGSNGEAATVTLGSFINLDKPADGDTTLNVRCSKDSNIDYTVSMSGGNSKDYTKRMLRNENGKEIAYNIYKDSAHTQVWGEGSDVVGAKEFNKSENMDSHPVYVHAPEQKGTALYSGKYTDQVTATVTYTGK